MSDNENLKGAFFVDGNCQILMKGTISINGATRYCAILKAQSQKGEEIHELVVSAGRVYVNPPEEKQNEKSPDVGGKITIDGHHYKFGGWNNVAKTGQNYLGVSLQVTDRQNSPPTGQPNNQPTSGWDNDKIPF
jgi:uncharacterized protein (DUF736 family)